MPSQVDAIRTDTAEVDPLVCGDFIGLANRVRVRCTALFASVAMGLVCSCGGTVAPTCAQLYSFESGLGEWQPRALDTDLNGTSIPWSVSTSLDRATDGTSSLKLTLSNLNDSGKIFVEHALLSPPDRPAKVSIDFDFGSRDGDANAFTIIAGVLPTSPTSAAELAAAYRDSTAVGLMAPGAFIWTHRHYEGLVDVGQDSAVIVIGVLGTYEVDRTYYFDAICISASP
jgi:hypothetical protein